MTGFYVSKSTFNLRDAQMEKEIVMNFPLGLGGTVIQL